MRLLDARALIHEGVSRLVDDDEVGKPLYAILSHTWGKEEVLFEDITLGPNHEIDTPAEEQRAALGYRMESRKRHEYWAMELDQMFKEKPKEDDSRGVCESCRSKNRPVIRQQGPHVKGGWKKVWSACLQACRDGYDYIWIDTCCIDKSSSTELSEALNSMFEWYAESAVCYTHLEDCRLCPAEFAPQSDNGQNWLEGCTEAQVRHCRWLIRGWTLQELIAPFARKFFDQDWTGIWRSEHIESILWNASGINKSMLPDTSVWGRSPQGWTMKVRDSLQEVPVVVKMSWAAKRQTTRVEDKAYSLLGLFGVNMPLLYGEGHKAFLRLQEEIIKSSNDDSIFAWDFVEDFEHKLYKNQVFAPSPRYFSWWLPAKEKEMKLRSFSSVPRPWLHLGGVNNSREAGPDLDFEISQKALHAKLPLIYWRKGDRRNEKITYRKRNRSKDDANRDRMLRESDLREGNAEKAVSIEKIKAEWTKKMKAAVRSNMSEKLFGEKSSKKFFFEEGSLEEGSSEGIPSEEESFKERDSSRHASNIESKSKIKNGHALLGCQLRTDDSLLVKIALRLSHTYRGNRYVNSQVVSERPGPNEIPEDLRSRLNLRLGRRHRLALYLDVPQRTADAQSIVIHRDSDIYRFHAPAFSFVESVVLSILHALRERKSMRQDTT